MAAKSNESPSLGQNEHCPGKARGKQSCCKEEQRESSEGTSPRMVYNSRSFYKLAKLIGQPVKITVAWGISRSVERRYSGVIIRIYLASGNMSLVDFVDDNNKFHTVIADDIVRIDLPDLRDEPDSQV